MIREAHTICWPLHPMASCVRHGETPGSRQGLQAGLSTIVQDAVLRNGQPEQPFPLTTDDRANYPGPLQGHPKIGRASCRESVCKYVSISVVAVSLTQKTN